MDNQAFHIYQQILQNPDHAELYIDLGYHLLADGNLKKSIKAYEISIILDQDLASLEVISLLGELYFQANLNSKISISSFYQRLLCVTPEKDKAIEYLRNLLSLYKYSSFTRQAHSSIEFNSPAWISKLYEDADILSIYLDSERMRFYDHVICLLDNNHIDVTSTLRVADVGCGSGHLLLGLQRQLPDAELTGFEYVESAMVVAQRVVPKAKIRWLDITAKSLAINDEYGIVFCTEVLEHLIDPSLALQNLLTLVQPSGLLVVTVPDGRRDTFIGHINFWSPESWEHFISRNVDSRAFTIETGVLDQENTNYAILRKEAELKDI